MSFAENLQTLRKRDKITQEELADKLQVSRQSVSKWETGEAYPETEKIIALCDIFQVSMDDLMRGDVAASKAPADEQPKDGGEVYSGSASQADRHDIDEESEHIKIADPGLAKKVARMKAAGGAVNGAIMAGAVISFFCMGGMLNLWHPGWLVFLLALSLCAFFDAVFAKNEDKLLRPLASRVFKGLAGMTMLLSVTIYLFIGCVYGIWHPSWVIFIIAPFLIGAFDAISKAANKYGEENE